MVPGLNTQIDAGARTGGGPGSGSVGRCRAVLSVPATDGTRMRKAFARGADEIVLDLEDAVPPDRKAAGRDLVAAALAEVRAADTAVAVRVNAVRSRWCHLDIEACAAAGDGPLSIVVPKVESAGDLAFVDRLLDGTEAAAGRTTRIRVQALIETAAGLRRLDEIVAAAPRLEGLILGYADLGASLGRSPDPDPLRWLHVQDTVLTAARAGGVRAIDGPFLGTADDADLRRAAQHARDLGFDGKWVIHPAQIPAVVGIFTASDDEVAHARAVLAALRDAQERGLGAVNHEGQMIDEAVAVAARRMLARAG